MATPSLSSSSSSVPPLPDFFDDSQAPKAAAAQENNNNNNNNITEKEKAVPPASGPLNSLYSLTSSFLSNLSFPSPSSSDDPLAFNGLPPKRQLARLKAQAAVVDEAIFDNKTILVRSLKHRSPALDNVRQSIDRHRRFFAMAEVRVLEESKHVLQAMFDNADQISKANIIVLQERKALINSLIDDLSDRLRLSSPPRLLAHDAAALFESPRQLCSQAPAMAPLLATRRDIEQQWRFLRGEYIRVCKATAATEAIDRTTRVLNVVEQFIEFYGGKMNGEYRPALELEYEFSRFLLDERTSEGSRIHKWLALVGGYADSGNPILTMEFLQSFLAKFESSFVADYSIPFDKRVWVRLLIQRVLFPRLWPLLERIDGESVRAEQENYAIQTDWLRAVTQEQLGIAKAFCVTGEQIKQYRLDQKQKKHEAAERANGSGQATPTVGAADGGADGAGESESVRSVRKISDLLKFDLFDSQFPSARKSPGPQPQPPQPHDEGDEQGKDGEGGNGGVLGEAHANDLSVDLNASVESDLFKQLFSPDAPVALPRSSLTASNSTNNLFGLFEADTPGPLFGDDLSASASRASSIAHAAASGSPSPPADDDAGGLFAGLNLSRASSAANTNKNSNEPASTTASATASTAPATATGSGSSIISSVASDSALSPSPAASPSQSIAPFHPAPASRLYRPFSLPIDLLDELPQLRSPLDMLQCVLSVAKSVYEAAREAAAVNSQGAKAAEGMGADCFFPIYLYVLIHSDVPDIHLRLRLMQIFALQASVRDGSGELSEHGYYLTCLEGAIHYIDTAQPDNF